MRNSKGILTILAGNLLFITLFFQLSFKSSGNINQYKGSAQTNKINEWHAPAIPTELSFAGEKAPMDRWDVREKFDREFLLNYFSPGSIIYLVKLANRNFPIIAQRLKANGVPEDFKYLCIAESNMQAWAVSKSGAVGYWQFMSGTAPGYGLETTAQVDERQHLEKATDAAAKYLKQAYARFGSWTAAAASYNCGMGGYNREASFQRTNNYYDLNLPEETNKYIYRILALKYLIENAGKLGYIVPADQKYGEIPVRTVNVTSSIPDLAQFAIQKGTTYKVLRILNPWLKGTALSVNGGKSYTIKLPK